jgi:predicted phage terminase large subunit-like protein
MNAFIDATEEEIQEEMARRNVGHFTHYTFKGFKENWHHRVVIDKLNKWVNREILNLMIFMPPRVGKSELKKRAISNILGRFPNRKVVGATYGDSLAGQESRDVQKILSSPEFIKLFGKILPTNCDKGSFPHWRNLVVNSQKTDTVFGGYYFSTSIGGTLTAMGADYLIVDDPVKNPKDAQSLSFQMNTWEWYNSVFCTRAEGSNVGKLIILTRWHENDLAGKILEQAKKDPNADQFEVISFPALNEDGPSELDPRNVGESIWLEKFSTEHYLKVKANAPSSTWISLYQQRPAPPSGAIIKSKWLKYWENLPPYFDLILSSWDCAFKETNNSDFVVGQIWGKIGSQKYLIDQVRDRMSFNDTLKAIKDLNDKWKPHLTLIEDKANGPAIIDVVKKKISGVIPVNPKTSKEARLRACEPTFEAGDVWIPHPRKTAWVDGFVLEITTFPSAKNDDQVDAMTQALDRLGKSGSFNTDESMQSSSIDSDLDRIIQGNW